MMPPFISDFGGAARVRRCERIGVRMKVRQTCRQFAKETECFRPGLAGTASFFTPSEFRRYDTHRLPQRSLARAGGGSV